MRQTVLVVACLLAACDAAPEPIPIDHFEGAYERAYCTWMASCGEANSVGACVTGLNVDYGQVVADVAAGRLSYDPDAAARCVDELASFGCDMRQHLEACGGQIFHAQVADGGTCFERYECTSGACAIPACPDACCAGTCVTPHAEGDACQTSEECPTGTQCAFATADHRTTICRRPLQEGEACFGDTGWCGHGLYCTQTYGPTDEVVAGKCTVPAGRGEACDPLHPAWSCARVDDYCSWETGTCVPRTDSSYACEAIGGGLLQQAFSSTCRLAYRCVDHACVALGDAGSACQDASQCSFGYDCVGSACVPYAAAPVCP